MTNNKKSPTDAEVAEWLRAGRIGLPPLRFRLKKKQPRYGQDRPWDFELEGQWADKKARFAVEYKRLYTPQAFETTLRQCVGTPLPAGIRPMMLLPYLRPAQLQQLELVGLSGIDLCGNGVVIVPESIRVFRTGAPNQFSTTAPIKNIYRKNTSMVARLFTATPAFPTLQAICTEINARNPFVQTGSRPPMRLGTVSKAIKGLEEDLVIDRSAGIRLLQPETLLSHLVDNYDPPRPIRTRRIKMSSTGSKLWIEIGDRIKGMAYPVAATGRSSAPRYAVMAREETIALYCPRPDELQDRLKGEETDRFPNVELIETDDEPPFFDTRSENGFLWASPIQSYLELMAGDKRDREAADQVKALLVRTMKGGAR